MIQMRNAVESDIELLFHWANDPAVRQSAFHSTEISWAEHEHWFAERIHSDTAKILIAETEGSPAGQIRFEWESSRAAWVIDYSVDANFRGQSLGTEIVRRGLLFMQRIAGNLDVVASVKMDNAASIRVFQKNGFLVEARTDDTITFRVHV